MRNMSLQQATALPRNMSLQQTHVARVGVEALASQKKKSMFNRAWLSAGDVGFVNAKLDGFKDVDSVTYQLLVGEFVESFDVHVQRLHKVETKSDVAEVHQLVLQLPRFAKILDGELSHAKILDCELSHLSKCWDDIWGSFLESVEKKWRLANSMSLGQEQQDMTECDMNVFGFCAPLERFSRRCRIQSVMLRTMSYASCRCLAEMGTANAYGQDGQSAWTPQYRCCSDRCQMGVIHHT